MCVGKHEPAGKRIKVVDVGDGGVGPLVLAAAGVVETEVLHDV